MKKSSNYKPQKAKNKASQKPAVKLVDQAPHMAEGFAGAKMQALRGKSAGGIHKFGKTP